MRSKIIIAGGSGFLGHSIIKKLQQQDTDIVILSRKKNFVKDNISYVQWDAETSGDWTKELEHSTAIINFVGKSVNCRYTPQNKAEIISSRVNATLAIGNAIKQATHPPAVWINAGSAAIFGNGGHAIKTETSLPGTGFSAEVCKKWEEAFYRIETAATRKVLLRIGVVLQKGTGLLQPFVKLVRLGLGGKMGRGDQYISWIHEDDFTNIIKACIDSDEYLGTIHCSSPSPVQNKEFLGLLRKACNVKVALPNPSLLLKVGAVFANTEAELLLTGRRVVSSILEERKFSFQYINIEDAFNQLLNKSS